MSNTMQPICADLAAEHQALDDIVAGLTEHDWTRPTPAAGWTIKDQIGHLAYFDATALQSAVDPEGFARDAATLTASLGATEDPTLVHARSITGAELLQEWRDGRVAMLAAFRDLDPRQRMPWYGPPMAAMSFATARLMETWAHGQDVCDTLGVQREATDRLRHVAHIGVRARPYAYLVNGKTAPEADVHVDLVGPRGDHWTWGDPAAADSVRGSALGFCLVVTQRRHVLDTDLDVRGPLAAEWMKIAQAFAGPAGPGRQPGEFRLTGP